MRLGFAVAKSRRPLTGGRTFESDSQAKSQAAAQTKAAQFANMYTSKLYYQLREFTTPAVGGLRVSQTDDTSYVPAPQVSPAPDATLPGAWSMWRSDYPEHVVHLGHLLDWWNPDDVRVPKSAAKFDTLARLAYRNPVRCATRGGALWRGKA